MVPFLWMLFPALSVAKPAWNNLLSAQEHRNINNKDDFTEPYTAFLEKIVWLEGSRCRHPSTSTPHQCNHPLHATTNLLMIFDNKFDIN
jgi:hypothetical protein